MDGGVDVWLLDGCWWRKCWDGWCWYGVTRYIGPSPTQGQDPGLIYEPPTGAVDGVNAHSRRVKTLRYVILPLQGIDNPEGVL